MTRPGIDWELVRSRLRASQLALDEAQAENPDRIEAAYRQRAVRLAKVQAAQKPGSAGVPVLVFRLGPERYAIELKDLAEVLPFSGCTRAPGSPPHFRGVINLRGELLPVLDLKRLLALSGDDGQESGFVLALRRRGREIGLKVDQVEEFREISPEQLSIPAQGGYVKGIASGTLMLLNTGAVLEEVFSQEEFLP